MPAVQYFRILFGKQPALRLLRGRRHYAVSPADGRHACRNGCLPERYSEQLCCGLYCIAVIG